MLHRLWLNWKSSNKAKKSTRGDVGGFGREYKGWSYCRPSWAGRSRVDGGADQDVWWWLAGTAVWGRDLDERLRKPAIYFSASATMAAVVDDSSGRYPIVIVLRMKHSIRDQSMADAEPHQAGEAYRRRARVTSWSALIGNPWLHRIRRA